MSRYSRFLVVRDKEKIPKAVTTKASVEKTDKIRLNLRDAFIRV